MRKIFFAVFASLLLLSAAAFAQPPSPTQCVTTVAAGGTGDQIQFPAIPCWPTTTLVIMKAGAANTTTTPAISVNGGPFQTITNFDGSPLSVGLFQPGQYRLLSYNGTNWLALSAGAIFNTQGLAVTPTNATLKATVGETSGETIYRAGFNAAGDGGDATYTFSSTNCTISGGDNGLQVQPTSGPGCFILSPPAAGTSIMVWGAQKEGTPGYSGAPPVDPAGTFDSTSAINAACATGLPLRIPAGRFHVTNTISCAFQQLQGVGGTTQQGIIDVGSDFNMSAAGVLNIVPGSSSNQMGAQPSAIDIEFYQNPANFPTITGNITGSTLTVTSGSVLVGNGVSASTLPPGDYIVSGSSPTYTLALGQPGPARTGLTINVFQTVVGSISGTTLTTSSGTPAVGDIIAGPGIPNGVTITGGSGTSWTISQSLTVGSETISYYSLIRYPWAMIGTTPPARPLSANIRISRAWNGISFSGNYAPILTGITQIGAFNIPFLVDGALDYSFIHSMEVWPFGNEAVPSLTGIWDMNPPDVEIGYVDGLEVSNMALFASNITFLSDAQYVTGYQFGNLHLNGTAGAIIVDAGGIFAANLSLDVNGNGITVNGPFDSTFLHVGICKCITSSPANYIVNNQGELQIDGGLLSVAGTQTGPLIVASSSGGPSSTTIRGMGIHAPLALTNSLISQSGTAAGLVLDGLTTVESGTDSAPLVNVANDIGTNYLDHLNFANWGTSTVAVAIAPSGVSGHYDLPTVAFPITSTPQFSTNGDFSPVGNTVTGWYKLLGDHVSFQLKDTFSTNTYTTASGAFGLLTNLPFGVPATGQINFPIPTEMNFVTFGAGFTPGGMQISYTNPITLNPLLFQSNAAETQMGTTNIPASTSNIMFQLGGSYPIR